MANDRRVEKVNLKALFETQAKLDADILAKHPVQPGEDRLSKKILALQVELGECANEWRGFKFWSNDQKPRTKIEHLCPICSGTGKETLDEYFSCMCEECDGSGKLAESNPLLEEYVDCLHFILSIGLDLGLADIPKGVKDIDFGLTTTIDLFSECYTGISEFNGSVIWNGDIVTDKSTDYWFDYTVKAFINLGESLGFTWDQVEAAYYEKNKINLQRQENGY